MATTIAKKTSPAKEKQLNVPAVGIPAVLSELKRMNDLNEQSIELSERNSQINKEHNEWFRRRIDGKVRTPEEQEKEDQEWKESVGKAKKTAGIIAIVIGILLLK